MPKIENDFVVPKTKWVLESSVSERVFDVPQKGYIYACQCYPCDMDIKDAQLYEVERFNDHISIKNTFRDSPFICVNYVVLPNETREFPSTSDFAVSCADTSKPIKKWVVFSVVDDKIRVENMSDCAIFVRAVLPYGKSADLRQFDHFYYVEDCYFAVGRIEETDDWEADDWD